MIDILNKCHTDPKFINNDYVTFLLVTLTVQDIDYLFFKKNSFCSFCNLIFYKCPCGVHVLASPKVTLRSLECNEPPKEAIAEGCYVRK